MKRENEPYILFDFQIFNYQKFGGISRYFCEIIKRMHMTSKLSIRYSDNYHLYQLNEDCNYLCTKDISFNSNKEDSWYENVIYTKECLQSSSHYIFHPTYYNPYFFEYIGENPYVITVHDMIYEKFPRLFPEAQLIISQKREVIKKADRIIAISENTKKDIVEILAVDPDVIDVVYHGTNVTVSEESSFDELPERYLLFVGNRYSYKNFERFLEAFSLLTEEDKDLSLICTGNQFNQYEMRLIEKLKLHNHVFQTCVPDTVLGELYAKAELFVFPSLYEGFGLPILEAYACHCPVALSNTSCFPEIAGDAAVYFNPYSIEDMTNTIKSVLYDSNKRLELINRGIKRLTLYSWEKSVIGTENVYKKLLKKE